MSVGKESIGRRVNVKGRGLGTLLFFGPTDLQPGDWCGIQLDEPVVS